MTIKYIYVCDKCQKEFTAEADAGICEAAHNTIAGTKAVYGQGQILPKSIEVTFIDGGKRIYVLS